jgi:hypothetical protein
MNSMTRRGHSMQDHSTESIGSKGSSALATIMSSSEAELWLTVVNALNQGRTPEAITTALLAFASLADSRAVKKASQMYSGRLYSGSSVFYCLDTTQTSKVTSATSTAPDLT